MSDVETGTDHLIRRLKLEYSNMSPGFSVSPSAVKAAVKHRRQRRLGVGVVAVLLAGVTAGGMHVLSNSQQTDSPRLDASGITIRSGSVERYASSTAADWVNGASEVVLVRPTSEERGIASSASDGTGDMFVSRRVLVEVDESLWVSTTKRSSVVHAGDSIILSMPGWVQQDDGHLTRLAIAGQPRMEVGHTYVVALVAPDCEHSASSNAEWSALGSAAIWPADQGRIGHGESEGRRVDGDSDQAEPASLEQQLMGQPVAAIQRALDAHTPLVGSAKQHDC